jgi:hypothetical protein
MDTADQGVTLVRLVASVNQVLPVFSSPVLLVVGLAGVAGVVRALYRALVKVGA